MGDSQDQKENIHDEPRPLLKNKPLREIGLPLTDSDWATILAISDWGPVYRAVLEKYKAANNLDLVPAEVERDLKRGGAQLVSFPREKINAIFIKCGLPYRLMASSIGGRSSWTFLPHRLFKIP